jgi:hypothetical protein
VERNGKDAQDGKCGQDGGWINGVIRGWVHVEKKQNAVGAMSVRE